MTSTGKELSMAYLSEAIWSLQSELETFTHSKQERQQLLSELNALHRERCARTGHEPDRDGEECLECGEWLV